MATGPDLEGVGSQAGDLAAALAALGGSATLFIILPVWPALAGAGLTACLVWLSLIDLRFRLLPDWLTLPLLLCGLAVSAIDLGPGLIASAGGAAIGYGVIAALAYAYRTARGIHGIGLGDAKLLAAIGAWVGLSLVPFAVLAASLIGLAAYAVARRGGSWDRRDAIAFGPCLAAAGWLTFIALHLAFDPSALFKAVAFPA